MNWSTISIFVLFGISLVCAGLWLDAIRHDDPPSAIRTARNKCAAWTVVALACLAWGLA